MGGSIKFALTVDVIVVAALVAIVSAVPDADTCESTVCSTLQTIHKTVPKFVSRVERKLCPSITTKDHATTCSNVLNSQMADLLQEKMVTRKALKNCMGEGADEQSSDDACDNTLACKTVNFISKSMPGYLTEIEQHLCVEKSTCRKFFSVYRQQLVSALQLELAHSTSFLHCENFTDDE
uniref:Uncharacterized protein n=1 Tax=Plectus sambesii TaxID=2011161 RepID=A0A914V4F1_9BILA